MQIPPASVLCNNIFFQENRQTPASEKINSSPDIRNNPRWNPYLRNRHSMYISKRNSSYSAGLKVDVKRLLDNSLEENEETVSEEHLNMIRKRQALLLVTIQTMTLFHHNQILEHKLSALHKRVVHQIQKERQKNNDSILK